MRPILFSFLVASLCFGTAIAQDLGNSRKLPVKNAPIVTYVPPAVPRQGGDTIADATIIPSLPYSNTGTTAGYLDDYDEICPYDTPGSPDVVFSFTPDSYHHISVDLCGSSYDTKTYIYDADLNLIACNDDAYFGDPCGVYVSKIENAGLLGGTTYFIIIDGYGGDFGEYVLLVEGYEACLVVSPDDAVAEGEPQLHNGYQDAYNGGCYSPEYGTPFQAINWTNDEDGLPPYDGVAWLYGKSGWYYGAGGVTYRDTDWFTVTALETGMMEFTVVPEYPCYMAVIRPPDCSTLDIYLFDATNCDAPTTLTFPVTAGQEDWLWVGPTTFTGPVTEFPYFMAVTNNTFDIVPEKEMSWGGVKALYR